MERELFGIKFPNPVGLAAGFDKNAVLFKELSAYLQTNNTTKPASTLHSLHKGYFFHDEKCTLFNIQLSHFRKLPSNEPSNEYQNTASAHSPWTISI